MFQRGYVRSTNKRPSLDATAAANDRSCDLLAYEDQAMLMVHSYAGQEAVIQVLWFYQRPLHLDGLRRFHRNLGRGMLARRIVRSPLPFGRARWLSVPAPQAELEVTNPTMPAEQRHDWADLQVNLPLDPELGPGWRLSAQKFNDDSTMVSLVISHCIADGAATIMAICDAVNDTERDLSYPSSTSRNLLGRMLTDLVQIAVDLPDIFTALGSGARTILKRPNGVIPPQSRRKTTSPLHLHGYSAHHAGHDQPIQLPSVSLFTNAEHWDELARSRGSNRFTLIAAVASSVAKRMGRHLAGASQLSIPINLRRGYMDMGANRVTIAQLTVPGQSLGADLSTLRKAIKKGLIAARRSPDAMFSLLPLIPLIPRWAFGWILEQTFSSDNRHSVTCSYNGDLPEEVLAVDGAEADKLWYRGVDRQVTHLNLEHRHGVFTLLASSIKGLIIATFIAYQPGRANTKQELQELIQNELTELGIQATFF